MYRQKISFVLLNFLSIFVMAVFIIFTFAQIGIHSTPPYGLSRNAVSINVGILGDSVVSKTQEKELLNALNRILEKNEILLIHENIDFLGLGIYENKDKKTLSKLLGVDLSNRNSAALLNVGDSTTSPKIGDTIQSVNGIALKIIGIREKSSPLTNSDKTYVYNYFDDPSLSGYFYFDHPDRLFINNILQTEIIPLFMKNHMQIVSENSIANNSIDLITRLFNNKVYLFSLAITIFVYYNLLMCYSQIMAKQNKKIAVHTLVGGYTPRIARIITMTYIPSILIGTLLGLLVYSIIFNRGLLVLSMQSFSVCLLLHLLLSVLSIYFVVYWHSKYNRMVGELK